MVTATLEGTHLFRTFLPNADRVELVGDFTGWRDRAITMTREDTGWWSATVAVEAGDHDFKYLVDGSKWVPDYAASGVRANQFGGWVSLLQVAQAEGQLAAA